MSPAQLPDEHIGKITSPPAYSAPLQTSDIQDGEDDKKRDLPQETDGANTTAANSLKDDNSSIQEQSGVTRIEALYIVFRKGWKIWLLWGSLAIIAFVYALSQQTTYTYLQFATSAFGTHAFLGTISVIVSIMSGVAKPFIAKVRSSNPLRRGANKKVADLTSRPTALALAVFFYAIGYIVVASAQRAVDVAGGEVLYTIGNTGIDLLMTIILADITSLQNRGLANGLFASPFILTCWIAGYITQGINAYSANGWRWGYGMFVILVPVCMAPVLVVLVWADRRAKRLGALSLASSSAARRQVLEGHAPLPHRPFLATVLHFWSVIDAFGLLLLGFGFGLILTPFTISATAQGGYSNPSIIAMLCIGGILLIAFTVWEWTICAHPIMPRRVLNRSLLCSIAIDFGYFFSGYISDTYLSSWIYIVKNEWSDRDYNYFQNILTVGLCFFGVIVGVIQRYTHRYKYLQIFGLFTRSLGMGLTYYAIKNPTDVVLVWGRILVSMGGACSVIGSQLASQASVPHQDMAIAISLLSLWTSIGGSIGSAISASIWTNKLPYYLEQNLGGVLNSTQIEAIYGDIITARAAEPRDLVLASYNSTMHYLLLPAFILSFVPIIAGFMTTNFYLGEKHNAIEDKVVKLRTEEETDPAVLQQMAWEAEQRAREQVAGPAGRA